MGYPGVGKYTVAVELQRLAAAAGSRFVVLDNHHTSNVILSVLPVDGVGPLPETVWDRVGEVRDALLRAIKDLSPPDWSFVFTNVLTEHNPRDTQAVDRLIELAAERHSHYVPVRLTCRTDELLRRVPQPDRKTRLKWIDPNGVRTFVDTTELIGIDHPALIDIDVTSLTPEATASRILDHLVTIQSTR